MQKLKLPLSIGALLLASNLVGANLSSAATYWVATTGSDSNSCSSVSGASDPGRYKRTIGAGIACMAGAGNTVIIKDGTYTGNNQFNFPAPGVSWSSPNVIKAQNRRKVTYQPPSSNTDGYGIQLGSTRKFIRFQGIVLDGTYLTTGNGIKTMGSKDLEFIDVEIKNTSKGSAVAIDKVSSRIRFADCSVHDVKEPVLNDAGAHGIYVRGAFNTIERCDISNIQGYGIQLYEETANASNDNIVRYNIIRNAGQLNPNRQGGIVIGTGTRHKVYGNIIYSSKMHGIVARNSGSEIYNNTIYNNPGRGIELTGSNYKVRNNIVFNNGVNIYTTGSGNTLSNNLTTEPSFVDASTGNFRLKSGSTAIDKGAIISMVTMDLDGTPRPTGAAFDIGAYEYKSSSTGSVSTLPSAPSALQASAN